MDTPSSVVIEQLYLALERSHSHEITLWWLLGFFFIYSVFLMWLTKYKHEQKEDLRIENSQLKIGMQDMEWQLGIFKNCDMLHNLGKTFEEFVAKGFVKERMKIFKPITCDIMVLKILETDHIIDAMNIFKRINDIPVAYGKYRHELAEEIAQRVNDHVYNLFCEWLKNANYDDVLLMHGCVRDRKGFESQGITPWQSMIFYFHTVISVKNNSTDISDFFVKKMEVLSKEDFAELQLDTDSNFDNYFEFYQRNYLDEETQLSTKKKLMGFRNWAQNHIHMAEHSEKALKIMTVLAESDLLADKPVVSVE